MQLIYLIKDYSLTLIKRDELLFLKTSLNHRYVNVQDVMDILSQSEL